MKKILNIPYYSQHRDIKSKYWKSRACSIVCVKTVLNFLCNSEKSPSDCGYDLPTIEGLIKEGVYIKGLDKNKDWIQDKIVMLLRNHGISAYQQEFKSMNIEVSVGKESESKYSEKMFSGGLEKIIKKLEENKLILVSVTKKFKEGKKFHMVVLTGFEMNKNGEIKGFYYNDTDYNNEQEGKDLFVDIEIFKKYWRRMAIFVG